MLRVAGILSWLGLVGLCWLVSAGAARAAVDDGDLPVINPVPTAEHYSAPYLPPESEQSTGSATFVDGGFRGAPTESGTPTLYRFPSADRRRRDVGRFKVTSPANSLQHEVAIVRRTNPGAHEPAWTKVAWTVVDMSQTPAGDGFVYAPLATPVRLEAGPGSQPEEYLLVSREYYGVQEYYYGSTPLGDLPTLTYDQSQGIHVIGAGFFDVDQTNWTQVTSPPADPQCYGPLNFKFK